MSVCKEASSGKPDGTSKRHRSPPKLQIAVMAATYPDPYQPSSDEIRCSVASQPSGEQANGNRFMASG